MFLLARLVFMTFLSVYVCVTPRIVAAGPTMTEVAFNVSIPKWAPEEKKLSDHWPVSVELECPDQGVNMCHD